MLSASQLQTDFQARIRGEFQKFFFGIGFLCLICLGGQACTSGSSPINITRGGDDGGDGVTHSGPTGFSSVLSGTDLKIQSSTNFRSLTISNPFSFDSNVNSISRTKSSRHQQEDDIFNLGPDVLGEGR